MLRFFETLIVPTAHETPGNPPSGLLSFYWFFVRQAKGLFLALLVVSFFVAVADAAVPVFMGKLVKVLTSSTPQTVYAEGSTMIFGLIVLVLIIKPLVAAPPAPVPAAG